MRSLFLKIFLSFWAAVVLFLGLAILVIRATSPAREPRFELAKVLTEAVNAYHSGGEHAVGQYLEDLQVAQHVRVNVYDQSGRELSGRVAPPWIDDMRRTGQHRHRSWMEGMLPERLSRQTLTIDGQQYTLVLETFPGPTIFFGPHDIPGLGLTMLVISSGLVCYLLARSLTSPVRRLRSATQRLAAGDLTARTGAPRKDAATNWPN